MKKRIGFAIVDFIIGVLLIVGPKTLFKVCDTSEMVMKCHWSSRAVIGVGILYILLSVLIVVFKQQGEQILLGILTIALGIIAILIPSVLIGGCSNSMMNCQSLTFPVIYLLAAISIVAAIIYLIYSVKVVGKSEK